MHPYQKSGVIPIVGGSFAAMGIAISAAVCGIANAYVVHWSPVIGVVFLFCVPVPILLVATLLLAAGCGFSIVPLLKLGKIRNDAFDRTACAGALLIYVWAYWSTAQSASGWAPLHWQAWLPTSSFEFAETLIARDGSLIVLLWIVETVLIGLAIFTVTLTRREVPFCEQCDSWTQVQDGYLLLQGQPQDDQWIQFKAGDFEQLLAIPILEEKSPEYMRLDLASCPHCQKSHFLAIQAIVPSAVADQGAIHDRFVPFQELSAGEFQALEQLSIGIEPVKPT
jgi:hypothetical protein